MVHMHDIVPMNILVSKCIVCDVTLLAEPWHCEGPSAYICIYVTTRYQHEFVSFMYHHNQGN